MLVAAVGGANSRDVLRQQIPDDADWVVLSVGVNGSTPWKSVGPDEFTANCERMLGTSGTQRYLVLGPGLVIERGVAGERTNKGLSAYAAALRRTAVAHSARFVSMADLLNDSDLAEDGVHFNDSGYRKLADRVLVELVSSQA